jgi:hypothetical protein
VKLGLVLVGEEGRPWLMVDRGLTLPFQVCYLLLLQAWIERDWRGVAWEADVPSVG